MFNYKTFCIAALRRASYRTPMRNAALAKARIDKGIYECAICKEQGLSVRHPRKNVQVDHIIPCVDPIVGWINLDEFASRLFCEVDGLQVICKPHHKEKSKQEAGLRAATKKKQKELEKCT